MQSELQNQHDLVSLNDIWQSTSSSLLESYRLFFSDKKWIILTLLTLIYQRNKLYTRSVASAHVIIIFQSLLQYGTVYHWPTATGLTEVISNLCIQSLLFFPHGQKGSNSEGSKFQTIIKPTRSYSVGKGRRLDGSSLWAGFSPQNIVWMMPEWKGKFHKEWKG